jgi:RND superfamily putative drug exporter
MRRLGELVLRHRLMVVVGWMVIAVAGAMVTSTVSDRMTVNFSLPGQPGTRRRTRSSRRSTTAGTPRRCSSP